MPSQFVTDSPPIPTVAKQKDAEGINWVDTGFGSRWVPGCKSCKWYLDCRETKGVGPDHDFCEWPPHVRWYENKHAGGRIHE